MFDTSVMQGNGMYVYQPVNGVNNNSSGVFWNRSNVGYGSQNDGIEMSVLTGQNQMGVSGMDVFGLDNQGVKTPGLVGGQDRVVDDPFGLFGMTQTREPQLEPVYTPNASLNPIIRINEDCITNKKCKTCNRFYYRSDDPENPCCYHTGLFKNVGTSSYFAGMKLGSWTCCGATEQDHKGCKTGVHIEDRETTDMLNLFGTVTETERDASDLYPDLFANKEEDVQLEETVEGEFESPLDIFSTPSNVEKTVVDKDQVDINGESDYISHYVSSTDTLPGLALHYGVSVKKLKSINKIRQNNELYSFYKITIPKKSDELLVVIDHEDQSDKIKRMMINKFMSRNKVPREVALYYLDIHEYNFDNAQKDYLEDLEWEQNNSHLNLTSTRCH
eukprot:TRINITY_DN1168_c0_g1_i5.p1 TRINITY_DN1168_c0_g1~~TRINITY_DN1168_c0_g1_i5.p1  ORF type:complete len:388 (-),score=80.80 TRINITY_DN1168_c0_g1_i5:2166-3329(-)